jgi:hypothetical protein
MQPRDNGRDDVIKPEFVVAKDGVGARRSCGREHGRATASPAVTDGGNTSASPAVDDEPMATILIFLCFLRLSVRFGSE